MKRKFVWFLFGAILLLVIIVITMSSMMPDSSDKVLARLLSKQIDFKVLSVDHEDSTLNVYSFGNRNQRPLVLIHGSPGDWSAWENIIANDTILDNYHVIAMDRPGYGKTTVPAKVDLQSQARAVWSVINELHLSNIVVVGHSYGGAIVEQLLVEGDEYFDLAFMVAPTSSPEHMAPRWYNKVASWYIVKTILSVNLLSSNTEMLGLPASLKKLEDGLDKVETPIIFMQGTDDVLVPFGTVDYFKSVKPEGVEYIILEGMNHFIPWSNPELINEVLIKNRKNEGGI